MLRPVASYRVLGPPAPRRFILHPKPEPQSERQSWVVDTAHASVAAAWSDGTLWLRGDHVYAVDSGVCEHLTPGEAPPPGFESPMPCAWTSLVPVLGARYVITAGTAQAPDPTLTERAALLDSLLDVPPAPQPGFFARALGKHAPPPEAAALVIDFIDEPTPADLPAWLADLQARTVDLSWVANESGPGLIHVIREPMRGKTDVRAALLDHARQDPELTTLVRTHVEYWLLDGGGEPVEEGRLVPDDPMRGWIEDLELDAIAEHISGSACDWLDPCTSHARQASLLSLPGTAVLTAVRSLVDRPAIVAVVSATEDPVLAVHLVGGIDRQSGDLVGFALQRIWT